MRRLATKVAVSIPKDLYQALERARKKNGKSRSAVVQNALRHWLNQQQEAEQVRQYVEGYRRMPETEEETARVDAVSRRALLTEEW